MIVWTLYVCVLIALSPTESAAKIDATCNTSDPEEPPEWKGIASSVLSAFGVIPEISVMTTIAGSVIALWGAAEKPEGFDEQWKKCIGFWMDAKIDNSNYREALDKLLDMKVLLENIKNKTETYPFTKVEYEDIKTWLGQISDKADDVKAKAAGAFNPQYFMIAYDGALVTEIAAVYLTLSKLKDRGDLKKIKQIKSLYRTRMGNYRSYLAQIDTETLWKNSTQQHAFWPDWGITKISSENEYRGRCERHSENIEFSCMGHFDCKLTDQTGRTKAPEANCHGCNEAWYSGCHGFRGDCNPTTCRNAYEKYSGLELKAKENMHKLLFGMNALVDTADKHFAPMRCTGQDDGCCTTKTPCGLWEGDCDKDSHCNAGLKCGNSNCKWNSGLIGIGEDDCCE